MRYFIEDRATRRNSLRQHFALMRAAPALALAVLASLSPVACAATSATPATPDPDACTLARRADVQALIAAPGTTLRSASSHLEPGKSSCVWSARENGLTDDAPPTGMLSLDFYHFANAARAHLGVRRPGSSLAPPTLARTADPADAVMRISHDETVAVHGADVAVVHAVAQRAVWDQPGWTWRLEALALGAAGAQVLGPAHANTLADVCHLIAPQHVLGLLTLSRSTLTSQADGGTRCNFSVRDASGKMSGWVSNQGSADFQRTDLATHAAALERQHEDTPFYPESRLVHTTDAGDRIVADPQHPESVAAVHGPYLVDLNVEDVTPAARAAPGWAYRVQRAALEVAGATIVAQPGQPPDPVVPGPEPKPQRFAWHVATHAPPAGSATLAPLLHLLWTLVKWKFFVLPVGIMLTVLLGFSLRRHRRLLWFLPVVPVYALLNLIIGTQIGVRLIHHYGVQGQATITGSYETNNQYNNRNVYGHNVLIRTAAGQIVQTSFEDDDFNVYPPHNATTYPSQGDEFTVRYLPGFPHDFIIVSNDDSPWAMRQRCDGLESVADQADNKQRFAPESAAFRDEAAAAHHALQAAGCEDDADD